MRRICSLIILASALSPALPAAETDCENPVGEIGANQCAAGEFRKVDAEMNMVHQDLLAIAHQRPSLATNLRKAQRPG